ncbi:hypothetical protein ABH945_002977 [Paraburkholderia sp. GAS333]
MSVGITRTAREAKLEANPNHAPDCRNASGAA